MKQNFENEVNGEGKTFVEQLEERMLKEDEKKQEEQEEGDEKSESEVRRQ
jgi:hypothetical protein